jgi:hypothetical protein
MSDVEAQKEPKILIPQHIVEDDKKKTELLIEQLSKKLSPELSTELEWAKAKLEVIDNLLERIKNNGN